MESEPGGTPSTLARAVRNARCNCLGHELIAAGLLILAGVTDQGEVGRWTRIG